MIFLGILFIIFITAAFYFVVFFFYPKLFLRFKYSRTLKEGQMSEDKTYYIPNAMSEDSIIKYELVKNANEGKKYAVITLDEKVSAISLAIYSFNYKKIATDLMIVNYVEASNKVIAEVKKDTFGLLIETVSYNDNQVIDIEKEARVRLFSSNLVSYSLAVGITTLIYGLLFVLSLAFISSPTNISYFFGDINYGVTILLTLLTFFVSSVATYIFTYFMNKSYFNEE